MKLMGEPMKRQKSLDPMGDLQGGSTKGAEQYAADVAAGKQNYDQGYVNRVTERVAPMDAQKRRKMQEMLKYRIRQKRGMK